MAIVLITGGTGMIGSALTSALVKKGHKVIILTRHPEKHMNPSQGVAYAGWDIAKKFIDKETIAKADHIVHLTGAGIADKRWTKKRKKEILDSRIESANLIRNALNEIPNHVRTVISASAIGWYGADPAIPNPHPFTEEDPADEGFLGQICRQWEAAFTGIDKSGIRSVRIRTGLVLSDTGGLLDAYKKPLGLGLATILGNGKQVLSWIHIEDLVRVYLLAIESESLQGVYNAVAPMPVSNKELVLKYAKQKKGNFFIPFYVPAFLLKIVLGEMSVEILKSCTVSCAKLHHEGFIFAVPSIESAIKV